MTDSKEFEFKKALTIAFEDEIIISGLGSYNLSMAKFVKYEERYYSLYRELCDPLYIDGTKISAEDIFSVEKTGFLMGEPVGVEEARKAPFFEIAMVGERPVGLIRADLIANVFEEVHKLDWTENGTQEIKDAFTDVSNFELGVIVVAEEMRGIGLSGELLKHLESYVREMGRVYLFSWVPERPENTPSKLFHLKNGFQVVAMYSSPEGFGFKDYRCNLFCKKV